MIRINFFLIIILNLGVAFAHPQKYINNLNEQKYLIHDAYSFGALPKSPLPFWNKEHQKIAIFIGFDDGNSKANYFRKVALTKVLSDSCIDGIYACGFYQNGDLLVNSKVSIKIFQADSGNSQSIRNHFVNSFVNYDAVIYMGHSRDGGGPDFLPAKRKPNGKVDYSWYKKNQPGFKDLKKALSKPSKSDKILALLSCNSAKHFKDEVSRFNHNVYYTKNLIQISSVEKLLFSTLNTIISRGRVSLLKTSQLTFEKQYLDYSH